MFFYETLLGLVILFCYNSVFSQVESFKSIDSEGVDFSSGDSIYNKEIDSLPLDYKESLAKYIEHKAFINRSEANKNRRFVLNSLNINSENSDYAPSFYKGQLVFSSSRNVRKISKMVDANNDQPFLDLYTTSISSDTKNVKKLKGEINSKFHESSPVFSKDGETVYFTRTNYSDKSRKERKNEKIVLKIYRAEYYDGNWNNITELPFCSNDYSVAHPTLSPDGQYLYFASDMPGTLGKSDIYQVRIFEDGNFGKPQNLGSQINTVGRETFPFMSDQGKLFFASDGHFGFGGLDVFVLMFNQFEETVVYNLGKPINGKDDDFTFIIDEENKTGYFASNRNGGKGGDDIYGFKQLTSFEDYFDKEPKTLQNFERVVKIKPPTKSDVFVSY